MPKTIPEYNQMGYAVSVRRDWERYWVYFSERIYAPDAMRHSFLDDGLRMCHIKFVRANKVK